MQDDRHQTTETLLRAARAQVVCHALLKRARLERLGTAAAPHACNILAACSRMTSNSHFDCARARCMCTRLARYNLEFVVFFPAALLSAVLSGVRKAGGISTLVSEIEIAHARVFNQKSSIVGRRALQRRDADAALFCFVAVELRSGVPFCSGFKALEIPLFQERSLHTNC